MQSVAESPEKIQRETATLGILMSLAMARYPEEAKRIQRGAKLVYRGHVAHVGGRWTVVSEDESKLYDVRRDGKGASCSCPDAKHNAPGGRCKHRFAVNLQCRLNNLLKEPARRYVATDQLNNVNGTATAIAPHVFYFQPFDSDGGYILAESGVSLGAEVA